ncbi:gliding motility-associated ABC transporter permease subunit GldF [Cryomorpha ignava]|uniref:Gliding motility-associated ABC transporter permease subunit GldF n=1 Tax=Cryomorpha ignava TaxID=101383 RepID=A0A7K3WUI7_9FLAO|nr:gliding motility-associated ABC transporter permease subunit GldF [Cryomorpha ignava]NEN24325.1 gliding motility-associated ABC transporter permease subunit GldF [Cryomorpha ignava]
MWALLLKEIRSFLSSVIGYVVMAVFLLLTGLFMWAFPGNLQVLDQGYATLDTLFYVAPWVFMFLVPAVTMRSFSEEKRTGTIELLFTRPLTDFQVILAKYFAGVVLVLLALLPTLIYYYSVYNLGNPVGNIDQGGTIGSYIGLLFLAAGFTAIGIFASSISDNQVVAFILALFLCFVCYSGLEQIASFDLLGSLDRFVQELGIAEHYDSMSRGVIDTRDVVYFISLSGIFIVLTKAVLQSRKWS